MSRHVSWWQDTGDHSRSLPTGPGPWPLSITDLLLSTAKLMPTSCWVPCPSQSKCPAARHLILSPASRFPKSASPSLVFAILQVLTLVFLSAERPELVPDEMGARFMSPWHRVSGGVWVTLPTSLGLLVSEKSGAVDTDPIAHGKHGSQLGTVAEEGEQIKLDSYPNKQ